MIVCQVPLSLSFSPLCFFFLCFSSLFFGSSCLLSFSSLFFIIVGTCSLRKIEKATGRTVQRPPMLRKFWSGEAQPKLGCPRYIEEGVVFEGFDNCAGTSVRSVALSLSLSFSFSLFLSSTHTCRFKENFFPRTTLVEIDEVMSVRVNQDRVASSLQWYAWLRFWLPYTLVLYMFSFTLSRENVGVTLQDSQIIVNFYPQCRGARLPNSSFEEVEILESGV